MTQIFTNWDSLEIYKVAEVFFHKNDFSNAAPLYKQAAHQHHADAQYRLGFMYHMGKGVKKNYKKAAKFYKKAAYQGHADAQYYLGTMYRYGWGVEQDDKKAAEL